MRGLLLLAALPAWAQTFQATPAAVRQGEVLHVRSGEAASARLDGRTIRLFPQADGTRLGLMPVPAGQAPGDYTLEFLSTGGSVLHQTPLTVRDARFLKQNVKLGPAQEQLRASPGEMETVRALRGTVSDTRYWSEPFRLPLPGCVSSPYGFQRWYNGKPAGYAHSGVDQRGAMGQPVRAIAAGMVRIVRTFNLHGNLVGIDHGQGVVSFYLHLSKFGVAEGAVVARGQVIGYVGSTGRSTGPHLHWTLSVNGIDVNPRQWVRLRPCGARR